MKAQGTGLRIAEDLDLLDARSRPKAYIALSGIGLLGIAAACSWCAIHGLASPSVRFDLFETLIWALTRWGAWPLLLPLGYALFCTIAKRYSSVTFGLLSALGVFFLGSSAFSWLMNRWSGGLWTPSEAAYYTAPPTFGSLALLLLIGAVLARRHLLAASATDTAGSNPTPARLSAWKGATETLVDVRDIESVCGAKNYVELRTSGDEVLIKRSSMADLEKKLRANDFLRVHRSYLVNRSNIVGLTGGKSKPVVVMQSGTRVPVGKSHRNRVFALLSEKSSQT